MKSFLNITRLSFLIIGGVVGAGFLSGRELLSFFGRGNFILNSVLSLTILAFLFLGAGFLATNEKSEIIEEKLFNKNKLNSCFLFIALSICLVCMLSGLNALVQTVLGLNTCLFSLVTVVVCFFLSNGGVKKVEKVNALLTLITIFLLVVCLFEKGKLNFVSYGSINFISPVVFSFINFYLCVPIFFKASKGKKRVEMIASVVISCTALIVLSILIFGRINACGENAKYLALPILATVEERKVFIVAVVMATGIVSSVILSYYSAIKILGKRKLFLKKTFFSVIIVLLSKISLTSVVEYMYPVIGGFGVLFSISVLKRLRETYKKNKIENNNIKSQRQVFYEKKKEQ